MARPRGAEGIGVNVNATKKPTPGAPTTIVLNIPPLKKRATSLLGNQEHVLFRLNDYQKGAGGVALLGCSINAERKKGERAIVEKEV